MVVVDSSLVDYTASIIGCGADSLPFIHLGIPVGNKMSRVGA